MQVSPAKCSQRKGCGEEEEVGETELKDHQQEETEGKLQLHSRLMLMEHTFSLLKVCILKVHMQKTYCIKYFCEALHFHWLKNLMF